MQSRRISINGQRWRVFLASSEAIADLMSPGEIDDYHGCCDYPAKRIYLSLDQSPKDMRETLIHEVIHAYLPSLNEEHTDGLARTICRSLDLLQGIA